MNQKLVVVRHVRASNAEFGDSVATDFSGEVVSDEVVADMATIEL